MMHLTSSIETCVLFGLCEISLSIFISPLMFSISQQCHQVIKDLTCQSDSLSRNIENKYIHINTICNGIGGSVVECSPATRAARVPFPADASFFFLFRQIFTIGEVESRI